MKVVICVLMLGITVSANAQKWDKKDKVMPYITRSIGVSFQKFDGLNGRVANFPQFKQLRDATGTLGLGWLKEQKRVISAGGILVGSSMSGDRDKKSSTVRYINLNADLGYDLLKSDRVMLYPLAGIGLQAYQGIFYKDNSSVAFNDVLQSPTVQNNISSVRFNNSFVVYRLGFGVSVKSAKYPSNAIGLQAGYTGSFKKHNWRSNENQVLAGAPQDKISQFYVSLVLMNQPMFGHHKDKK
ncbi:MAG: hypothetical protein ABJB11_11765 [Ferruginibacter sp.]